MVIIGSKPIPDEEPEPPRSNYFGMTQNFTKTWTICFDRQNSNITANNVDEDHDGGGDGSGSGGGGDSGGELELHNERKLKEKKRGGFGDVMRKLYLAPQILLSARGDREGSGRSTYSSLRLIKDATRNFNLENKIGEGGLGTVYKGILPDGTTIAVKKPTVLDRHTVEAFEIEEIFLRFLRHGEHPNIIQLYGSCWKKSNYLLVYEYMQNGDLGGFLSSDREGKNLERIVDWETRFKICLGIAKGLAYLHELNIVHRNMASPNILLDESFNPKICALGVAMQCPGEKLEVVSGTFGYMAPEYFEHGIVSEKVDVYSFGVVTLELLTRKKAISGNIHIGQGVLLAQLAKSYYNEGRLLNLIDKDIKRCISIEEATMMLNLAVSCVVSSPRSRPTMSEVVSILEKKTSMKPLPSPLEFDINSMTNLFSPIEVVPIHVASTITKEENHTHTTISHVDLISNVKESGSTHGEEGRILDQSNAKFEDEVQEVQNLKPYPGDSGRITIIDIGVHNLSSTSAETETEEENVHTVLSSDLMLEANVSTGEGEKGVVPKFKAKARTPNEIGELCHKREGMHHIECTEQELEIGCDEWKDSLVGYFLDEIKEELSDVDIEMVRKLWAVKGNVSVFTLSDGYFMFRFDRVEDKIRVLESSNLWQIVHTSLVLMKWDWKMKFDKYEMKSVPLWVKIYRLPLVLWSSSFLSKVGSGLGVLLYVDQKTKDRERLDYAKICIQMDVSKPLLESLTISLQGTDYQLKLEYDFRPLRCSICYTFGHIESKCVYKKKTTDTKTPTPDDNVFCINEHDVVGNVQDDIVPLNDEICTEKCTIPKDEFTKFLARASSLLDVTGKDIRLKLGVDVFNTIEDVDLYLPLEDISYICNYSEASLLNVIFYLRLLREKIASQGKENKFGFLNPVGLCTTNANDLSSEIFQGLSNSKCEFIFIPYLKNSHWILMVIKSKSMKIWWLDPLQQEMRYGRDVIMNSVMEALEESTKGIKNVGDPSWCVPSIVPKQKGNWECGYYVMRYMKEIIEEHPNPISTNKKFIKTTYNDADIDEIRFEWITYLGQFLKFK